MKFPTPKARISFQVKVLVPVITVMVLLTAATIWLVDRRIGNQLYSNAADQLETAANIFKKIQESHASELLSKYGNLKNEPRFKAATRTADVATLKYELDEITQEIIAEKEATVVTFTLVNDGHKQVISAKSSDEHLNTDDFQLRSAEAIRQAAGGLPIVDTIRVGSELFDVVAIPVGNESETAGVLTFGVIIDGAEAREIRQITRSEIVFLSDGQVAASSLPRADLSAANVARFNELAARTPSQDARTSPDILLHGDHYLCQPGRFDSKSGDTKLGYLLLSSYGKPLADFKQTQQMLLGAGAFGILFATALIWILIRQITRPLRDLRDSAEAVGRGDFSRRVEVSSRDECGELATAFNQMTENVKASRQELEKTVETLKATQNQLIQSEKLSGIGEFVAGVAHELNNPLTSVMGFSELLQQSEMPEQQRRYLDVIFKSAKRCQKIVQSLLSFARRHAPERKVVCVNAIVESAVEILQYQMRTSNIEVSTHLDPRLPATEVDTHQMQQVFLNIINNARQAMEAHQTKGWLRISTESSDGRVRIIFRDNGPGIAPENLKKIFNPFFTTKEVGKGTGLGLSLCYGIVGEHGGSITPYSTPGEGATFEIELPVAREVPAAIEKTTVASVAPVEPAPDGAGKRVLVVDDEDTILQMIREALTRNGYKVDIAHDGESALRRLGQYHYDLALCDWKMPGLNGQQVFERLNASDPEMSKRLIFITGDVVNQTTQDFLRAQGKVCLSKPFTLGEFRSAISRVISPK